MKNKHYIVTILISILVISGFGQTPEIAWRTHHASELIPGSEQPYTIRADEQGNVVTASVISSTLVGGITSIAKYSPQGELLWTVDVDSLQGDYVEPALVEIDGDGNLYVCGRSDINNDILIIKYSPEGEEQWCQRFQNDNQGGFVANIKAAVDHAGNLFLGMDPGGEEIKLLKYKTTGDLAWSRSYADTSIYEHQFHSLMLNGDGGVTLGCTLVDSVFFFWGLGVVYSRPFVIKYDSLGIDEWEYSEPHYNITDTRMADMVVDEHNNTYFATGNSIIKLDTEGYDYWEIPTPHNYNEEGFLNLDASGNVIYSSLFESSSNERDMQHFCFSPDGIKLWEHIHDGGENANDMIKDIYIDELDQICILNMVREMDDQIWRLIKIDTSGTEVWNQTVFESHDGSYVECYMVPDGLGNIAVAHSIAGEHYSTEFGNQLQSSMKTLKYSPEGEILWSILSDRGRISQDRVGEVAIDHEGNIFIVGVSIGADNVDHFALHKFNSRGDLLWSAYESALSTNQAWFPSLAIDGDGNAYITGMRGGFDVGDFCTMKFTGNGQLVWTRTYDGTRHCGDYPVDIVVGEDGRIYVSGWVNRSEGTQIGTICYNPDGTTQWEAIGGPGTGHAWGETVALDGDGNLFAGGTQYGTTYDYLLIKYSLSGELTWVATYDTPTRTRDEVGAMVIDESGCIYLTGTSNDLNSVSDKFTTVKFSPAGQLLWNAQFGDDSQSGRKAYDIVVDGNQNVIVAGRNSWDLDNHYTDSYIVKYDRDGNELWANHYPNFDLVDLALDPSENIYAYGLGSFSGSNVVIKYDADGNFLWEDKFGYSFWWGVGDMIAVDKNGSVYAAGQYVGGGGEWMILTAYNQTPTSVHPDNEILPSEFALKNFPNPFNPSTTISYDLPKLAEVNLTVYDVKGREVTTLVKTMRNAGTHNVQWNGLDDSGNQVSTGVYLAKLRAEDFSQTIKMLYLK